MSDQKSVVSVPSVRYSVDVHLCFTAHGIICGQHRKRQQTELQVTAYAQDQTFHGFAVIESHRGYDIESQQQGISIDRPMIVS